MAKYNVKYSCGHGIHEVVLFGKETERERKIEWMEGSMVCPECYKKEIEEKNKKMGIVVRIGTTMVPSTNVVLSVVGNTTPVKDILKQNGFSWVEMTEGKGLRGFFGGRTGFGWQKKIKYDLLTDELDKLKEVITITTLVNDITDFDIEIMRESYLTEEEAKQKKQELDTQVSEIVKPVKPNCYPVGYWNGKIYSGNSIYVNNKEVKLSSQDVIDIKKYQNDVTIYKNQIATIAAM